MKNQINNVNNAGVVKDSMGSKSRSRESIHNKDESLSYEEKSPLQPGLSVIHETRKSSNQLEGSNED